MPRRNSSAKPPARDGGDFTARDARGRRVAHELHIVESPTSSRREADERARERQRNARTPSPSTSGARPSRPITAAERAALRVYGESTPTLRVPAARRAPEHEQVTPAEAAALAILGRA
ncbi:hypothetical protein [uncultured Pseudokineococcus sp.]|uniref:hypothetical protein n=1 Tax=uncultured Pseudokineococcus sp. TaxID=1642928 RepID=UPI00260D8394|nr:hypothetical protein [uncultured Pseudokineococcus sp.]